MLYWFLPYNNTNQKSVIIIHTSPSSLISFPSSHPIPLGYHRAPDGFLCYTVTSHQLSILPYIPESEYMLMLLSPSSPSVSTTPLSMSVSTFLPCKQVHQYHFSRLQHRFAVKKIATQEHQCIYKKMAQWKHAFSSQWRKNEVTLEERQYSDSTTLLQSTTTEKIVVPPRPAKGKSRGETTLTRLHPGATNSHQVVSEKEEQETGSFLLIRQ